MQRMGILLNSLSAPQKINSKVVTQNSLANLPCTTLKGVGPRIKELLTKCGINTVQDLLFHLPIRYQDKTRITAIKQLRPGDVAVIEGVVTQNQITFASKRRSLQCDIQDATGCINIRFFHFNAAQKNSLAVGTTIRCYGEVRFGKKQLIMIHPEYRCIAAGEKLAVDDTLSPIYPSTEGMQQRFFYQLTTQALSLLDSGALLNEYLADDLLRQFKLPSLIKSLHYVHRPPTNANVANLVEYQHPAQRRLIFEELLAHHLCLRRIRASAKKQNAPVLKYDANITQQFLAQLSFALTQAQQQVVAEILGDISTHSPMLRLVQGDVGSGKTVVAVIALLQAVANGFQAALMAPTEILAEQHYQNLLQWLKPLKIEVVWLSGKIKNKQQIAVLNEIQLGKAKIIVGTHALFQEKVQFAQLGLIIIDEQHRFGVHQRLALREKGVGNNVVPHQLIMTATPIPRTLAMTIYADLDISIINELPPGRTPIKTIVISNNRRHEILERVHNAVAEKRQVYWVCTLIEESEAMQCQAAEMTYQQLQQELAEFRIGLVHGRLKPAEKEQIMLAFKSGEINILVATTVIEVGVNVPNASLMIIENAERLGLSQLHQLRGRVGRGNIASFCVLLYQFPLSQQAKERLDVMRNSNDGFVIAKRDLEIRGPGEVLGTRQTGLLQLRIANIVRDNYLLADVQKMADIILQNQPEIILPLINRWIGDAEQFGHV